MTDQRLGPALIAEALGTFILVFAGCGAIIVGTLPRPASLRRSVSPSWSRSTPWATFILVNVIVSVATDVRAVGQAAAIAIGRAVALGSLVGGPISGASMNPARSLGPLS